MGQLFVRSALAKGIAALRGRAIMSNYCVRGECHFWLRSLGVFIFGVGMIRKRKEAL